ncbi:hypothetical protein [Rhizobium leguminosarum]|uniref:hypothetical protein n=1 Tax=Rhizobium leguminosarum TaxID=384 RepID=UPI0013EECCDE|nr:hypothetical protein [Rhizobium leguminosarum]
MANSRLCSIPDCGKSHKSKGYCAAHYWRFRKHGDPMGGGTPFGVPMRFIHEVALLHTGEECLPWPFGKDEHGYGKINVNGKMMRAHRYVCETVHGEPPTPEHEAAHSCGKGNEGCIAPGHLGWKTHKENMADMLIHGTSNRGERQWKSKLTEAEVREIIAMKGKETHRNMAKRFGVSSGAISNIHAGLGWAWLTGISNSNPKVIIE